MVSKIKPLKILTYPNPKLRKVCSDVREETNKEEVNELIKRMFFTMNFYEGIGLSAPQVGVSLNVVVIGVDEQIALINPKITKLEGKMEIEEGCLSLPHVSGYVSRNSKIEVEYIDQEWQKKTLSAIGLLAACIQHECEHLNGVLYIDHLSRLKRQMIIKKMRKAGRII